MGEYDTTTWKRPSPAMMPAPPPNVGVGKIELGKTYPLMGGWKVQMRGHTEIDGEKFMVGWVLNDEGRPQFEHHFQLNGRDWTDNPNNPYAIDWPALERPSSKWTSNIEEL